MKTSFGRTCLILGLLSFALAAAVSAGRQAPVDGVTVPASTGMQLQGSADDDLVASAPDAGETDKAAACSLHDCLAAKPELALARVDHEPAAVWTNASLTNESKAFMAPGDDVQPKSKD